MKKILSFSGSMLVYHLLSSFMAFIMSPVMEFKILNSEAVSLMLMVLVPSIILYSMAYLEAWKFGFKTRGADVKGHALLGKGRVKFDGLLGVFIYSVPGIVLWILALLFREQLPDKLFRLYFFNYFGLYGIMKESYVYVVGVLMLVIMMISFIAFNFGFYDFSLKDKIVYQKEKKDN